MKKYLPLIRLVASTNSVRIVFTLVLLMVIGSVSSQEKQRLVTNNYFSVQFGAGIPIKDFADKDFQNTNAGLAKRGMMYEFNYHHLIKESLGFNILYRFQTHELDASVFSNHQLRSWDINEVKNGNWEMYSFMAGIFKSIPINSNKSVFLLFKFNAGVTSTYSPNLTLKTDFINVDQGRDRSNSFSYLAGSGLKFLTNKNIAFTFNADFYSTYVRFDEIRLVEYDWWTRKSAIVQSDQKIRLINLSAGILMQF